jgi:dipeptidyl-peptidase 4
MALAGQYINLQVDIRGSIGYGKAFRETFQGEWGGRDIEDLESGVEYLKTLPYVDGERIGIWGSSYGGTLTVFSLFKKPGLYKAGVAGAPAVDVAHFTTFDMHLSRRPNARPDIFEQGSALNLGENLRDHLLIIHGMQDDIVPFKTSMMLAEKLMLLGKDFDIAIAPTAVHGWSQKEYYGVFLLRKVAAYFDQYVGAGARPRDARPSSR